MMDNERIAELLRAIETGAAAIGLGIYVVGGAVRDALQGFDSSDIDLAVSGDPFPLAQGVAHILGGTFVALDEEHRVARLVWQGEIVDLAVFKDGVATIDEDLARRDFTVNSMAFSLADWLAGADPRFLRDPCQGSLDLAEGVLRLVTSGAIAADPLRILRGYRLCAQRGFRLGEDFSTATQATLARLAGVAVERIVNEFHLIFATSQAGELLVEMEQDGVLAQIFPELAVGRGVAQPASHHLDVLSHNLEALLCLEKVCAEPDLYFGNEADRVCAYLDNSRHLRCLKWAALFHDVGKVATRNESDGKITFYQHDQHGAALFRKVAARLKLASVESGLVTLFIAQHMRPFHLCNIMREAKVSIKACLRLAKAMGEHIPGLFLLAMADSLAGQGENKPHRMEDELGQLFHQVSQVMDTSITPVLSAPALLNGQDLIDAGFVPGPRFREILSALEQHQVMGYICSKKEALAWLANFSV